MKLNPVTERFILHWGEMGTKWGVNRTVAQIHALLYILGKPMNADEICETLNVARSNVSNSIKELQSLQLVHVTHILGDRRDYFATSDDVWTLFRTIVEQRQRREIEPTLAFLNELANSPEFAQENEAVRQKITDTRDFIGTNLEKIRIDSKLCFGEVKEFTDEFMPELSDKLVLYSGNQPIFDVYGVESAIQTALDKRVNLKSGGYLIIEQTEAMTTIDINTGAFVGHRNLEETIFNTNIEATKAIAQQLQLRNLGGIIIIDFIDMQTDEHRNRVLESLCDALSKDRVKTNVNGFTQLGLVEMTRKRTRESLEHVLCDECPTCHGRGRVKTVETVCYEIMREIIRVYHLFSSEQFVVYASPAVSEYLINEESHGLLPEVEMFIGKRVKVKTEQFYNQEQFDVVVM